MSHFSYLNIDLMSSLDHAFSFWNLLVKQLVTNKTSRQVLPVSKLWISKIWLFSHSSAEFPCRSSPEELLQICCTNNGIMKPSRLLTVFEFLPTPVLVFSFSSRSSILCRMSLAALMRQYMAQKHFLQICHYLKLLLWILMFQSHGWLNQLLQCRF